MAEEPLKNTVLRLIPLAVLLVLAGRPVGAGPLYPNPMLSSGDGGSDVLITDMNGDGRMDVASVSFGAGILAVHIAQEDGSFLAQPPLPVGRNPLDLTASDLNGDGRQDLIAASRDTGGLSLFFGQPDGTFVRQPPIFTGARVWHFTIGDLNEDGANDLVVVDPGSAQCLSVPPFTCVRLNVSTVILLNRGDGTFMPPAILPSGFIALDALLGDFDRDGHLDLVTGSAPPSDCIFFTCFASGLSLHLGRGDGTFEPEIRFAPGLRAGLTRGDFDGDGNLDLATVNLESRSISYFLGHGDGSTFPEVVLATTDDPMALTSGDLNADGLDDLIVAVRGGRLATFLGARDGLLVPRPEFTLIAGVVPYAVSAGDLYSDGIPDVAMASGGAYVNIALGLGDGTFRGPVPTATSVTGNQPASLAVADFNRDGKDDVVMVRPGADTCSGTPCPSPGRWTILLGGEAGALEENVTHLGARYDRIVSLDRNGDGNPDVALLGRDDDRVDFFLGAGDGSFSPGDRFDAEGLGPELGAAADFNGDGADDLVTANTRSNDLRFFPGSIAGGPETTPVSLPLPSLSLVLYALTVGDFDGNGHPDAALVARDVDSALAAVLIFPGLGDFTFGEPVQRPLYPTLEVAAADLNLDGIDEFLYRSGGDVVTLATEEGCLLCSGVSLRTGGSGAIGVRDLDGDRLPDLATIDDVFGVAVFRGLGDTSFRQAERFSTSGQSLAIGDFNGDGREDLATSTATSVVVIPNIGPPAIPFMARIAAPESVECDSRAAGSVTLDGSASGPYAQSFLWYRDLGPYGQALIGTGAVLNTILPLGPNRITLVVSGLGGAHAMTTVTVVVRDTIAPTLQLYPVPQLLWPPDHRMVPVFIYAYAFDVCDPYPRIVLLQASSNEADDDAGAGDGQTRGDIAGADAGTADFDLVLRAERDARGQGRFYSLTYGTSDDSGNSSSSVAGIVVPHDHSGGIEPLNVSVDESALGTVVGWNAVAGAGSYRVVRGNLGSLRMTEETIDLGSVLCIASGITGISTTGYEDAESPPAGQSFFYVVAWDDSTGHSYGAESASKPRSAGAGDCP